MGEENTIGCGEHGVSRPAFLCGHLFASQGDSAPVGVVTSTDEVEPGARPDAWCARCDEAFLEQGEWNDDSERDMDVRAICVRCWDSIVAHNRR